MNSVLFFVENGWAFGQIHHALIKHLSKHGIYSNLLDWRINYTNREHELLRRKYQFICTISDVVEVLINYGWPLDRIVAVAHCERDLALAVSKFNPGIFEQLHGHAVVHPDLIKTSADFGIRRVPTLLQVGIDTEHFNLPIPQALRVVGYGGAKTFILSNGVECKRGHLIPGIVTEAKLELREHEFYNHLAMPGYYQDIDALIVSSTYETVSLPGLEAAASGRLAISTKVGYFDGSYGVSCRMSETDFCEDALETLKYYAARPEDFQAACVNFRNAVQASYDWKNCIEAWVRLFK